MRDALIYMVFTLLCLTASLLPVAGADALAACAIQRSPGGSDTLRLHLDKECTDQEREAHALSAADLLQALAQNKNVDVSGAVILGDLAFDGLPSRALEDAGLMPSAQAKARSMNVARVHVVPGAIAIRDSVVRGSIQTTVKDAMVLMRGPLTMTGTTFDRMVDLSRTIFLGPVDFTGAVFVQKGFFIESLFEQPARFETTAFGVHSRFHKAVFRDTVTFHRAGFNGLSEFLQVTFEKDARFSQAYFKMGTGFSGSHFQGALDFSEATFEREAYFTFAVFDGDAYFRRATFRGDANFADAEFKGVDDFSKTFFNVEPRFTRAKVNTDRSVPKGLQDPRVLYVIAAALLAFSLIFVFILRKS
ncbi:MAG TPA: pentapeptide repeat-containing protein [Nitrospiraceae bacterium]|nr:pentapeptide repeat-containing protein [Nitrospiraceae bacterium]